MSGPLHLALLGEPQITLDGGPLTGFISAKAQALLFYLAVTGQPHSRETLATLLWGEMPDAAARKNLTKVLSNLRQLIDPYLVIERHSVTLNDQLALWLDVQQVQTALEAGVSNLDRLHQGVALYRADFLTGFYVKDAPEFEAWVIAERERLRNLALRLLERLVERLVVAQDLAAALEIASRWLTLDPLDEAAHRQMMTLLAGSGRRSAALAHYESCRQQLLAELGAEPLAETQALYHQLKTEGAAPPHNLSSPVTLFVGRQPELTQLTTMLKDPACRLLTLAGPGGIGKTRLALHIAGQYISPQSAVLAGEADFSDGVYFIPVPALETAEMLVPIVAEAVGFTFQPNRPPRHQLLDYLYQKSMLLVLDNLEQLLTPTPSGSTAFADTAALIIKILEIAPRLKILTTSRVRLNVPGEHLFTLAGLETPTWSEPDLPEDISGYSAVRLFLTSARRVQPDFALTPDNRAGIARICGLAQGMPLGIELAAAWVALLTPAEIAAEISQNLDFLQAAWPGVPERRRSMRAVFDHSWNLLQDQERNLFQQLAIFQGEFTRLAAQTVTGASLLDLMALVNKSLLHPNPAGRYRVHGLLRQYGLEKLKASTLDSRAAQDRHCAYYIELMARKSDELKGPQQQLALTELEAERENIRAAWLWAVAEGYLAQVGSAASPLSQLYVWRGGYEEGERLIRMAVEALSLTSSGADLRVRAELLAWQSVFVRLMGRLTAAQHLLRESLALLDDPALAGLEVRPERAFALLHLGEALRETDRAEARQQYEQSLALYRTTNDVWGQANALAALGWLIQHLGAYDEARALYAESLTLRQGLGDQQGIASSLMWVGGITLYQGHPQEAEPLLRESITIRRKLGDPAALARSLSKLGEALIWLGNFAEAETVLSESQSLYLKLGLREATAFANTLLGVIALHLGAFDQAHRWGDQALTVFREIDSPRGIAYGCLLLGGVALVQDTFAETEQRFQESLTLYRRLGQRDELAQTLALLGAMAHRQGQPTQAWAYLSEAIQTALDIHAFMPMMLVLPTLALLLVDQNQPEEAVALYGLAWRYPFIANSQWFEQVAGQRLTALNLPPEVWAEARKRGQTKALEPTLVEILAKTPARASA